MNDKQTCRIPMPEEELIRVFTCLDDQGKVKVLAAAYREKLRLLEERNEMN